MLKTGIRSNGYFGLEDYAIGLKKMKTHGYDCVDFQGLMSPASELYQMQEKDFIAYCVDLKKAANEAGIELWQVHSLWPCDDRTKQGREQSTLFHEKAVRAAGIMGAKYLVIHPVLPYGFDSEPSQEEAHELTIERLLRLLPVAKSEGVTVCLENMPMPQGHSFSSVQEVKDIVDFIHDDRVKICFDTGHCNVTGENHYEIIKLLGQDLVCLHIHDDIWRQDRHLMPFQGEINWAGVTSALKEISYNGCISLETCIHPKTPEPMKEQLQIALSNIAKFLAKEASVK